MKYYPKSTLLSILHCRAEAVKREILEDEGERWIMKQRVNTWREASGRHQEAIVTLSGSSFYNHHPPSHVLSKSSFGNSLFFRGLSFEVPCRRWLLMFKFFFCTWHTTISQGLFDGQACGVLDIKGDDLFQLSPPQEQFCLSKQGNGPLQWL